MGKAKENYFKITSRAVKVVFGIFLCLLSIVLILNIGYVARVLALPFIFFFGIGSYLIYLYLYILGMVLIFKGRLTVFKSKRKNFCLFFGLVAISLLITVSYQLAYSNIERIDTSVTTFLSTITKDYLDVKFLNMFTEYRFEGGIVGATLAGLINGVHVILSLAVACVTLIVCFFVFFSKEMHNAKKERIARMKAEDQLMASINFDELEHKEIEKKKTFLSLKRKEKANDKVDNNVFDKEICKEADIVTANDACHQEECAVANAIETSLSEAPKHMEETQMSNKSLETVFESRFSLSSPDDTFHDGEIEFVKARLDAKDNMETEDLLETPHLTEESFSSTPTLEETYEERVEAEETPYENMMNNTFVDQTTDNEYASESGVDIETMKEETVSDYRLEEETIEKEEDVAPAVPTYVQEAKKVEQSPQVIVKEPEIKVEEKPKVKIKWIAPSTEMLNIYEVGEALDENNRVALERKEIINKTFQNFSIGARCIDFVVGPSVTRYNIEYDAGVSVKNVEKLVFDISRDLQGVTARFEPIVEGQCTSGLEIPNACITTVSFKEVFEALPSVKEHPLAVGFGKNIGGKVIYADFDEFPHLLVAGTTGSGKSIYIHSVIATLIMRMSPNDLKIALVDPKQVEMTKYREMPHLLCPIITEASKAKVMLTKLATEMNRRYSIFDEADGSTNIKQYNEWADETGHDRMPYIVVVLDEYADLIETCKEIAAPVVSIAQKARAAGIHLLISTQRPSTNVINGVIKGNLPTHVALMTSSATDSVTILGEGGAEKLLGKGDMLVQSPLVSRVGMVRLQGCFIQNKEIARVVSYLKEHYPVNYDPDYLDLVDHAKEEGNRAMMEGEFVSKGDDEEEKYQSIKEWVMSLDSVSMSKIQSTCGVGFNRANRFFIRLQEEGVVSKEPASGNKGSKVLIHDKFYENNNGEGDVVSSSELASYK